MTTAAILVIGNEILSGKVQDENSPWLAQQLRGQGVDLQQILVLPDSLPVLTENIRLLSQRVDYLFTSGGIGPTHDDLTMEAVANAFHQPLQPHAELIAHVEGRLPDESRSSARMKSILPMCVLPSEAKISVHPNLFFPLVTVGNVIILPGVPHLFRRKFESFKDRYQGAPVHSLHFYTRADESTFASELGQIQARWPAVEVGSYPQRTEDGWQAMLTLDSRDAEALEACASEVKSMCERLKTH